MPDDSALVRRATAAGRYTEAESLAFRSLASAVRSSRPDSLRVAHALDQILDIWWHQSMIDPAIVDSVVVRALRIKEHALGPSDDDVAETLTSAAMFDGALARYPAGDAKMKRALAIRDRNPAPNPRGLAWTLNSNAIALMNYGRFEESRSAFERALAIREKTFGPESPSVAATLNPYGFLLQRLGDYTGARAVYERSLAIRVKSRGADHPDVARSLLTLSTLMTEIGDWDGARPLIERQLAIEQKAFGPTNPVIVGTLYRLSWVHAELGDDAVAKTYVARGDSILASRPREDAPVGEAAVQSHLGTKDFAGARLAAESAVAAIEGYFGKESPRLVRALETLADVYRRSGDREGSLRALDRAHAIALRAFGSQDPKTARIDYRRAVALAELGRIDLALDAALRAEDNAREHLRVTARGISERQALRYAAVRTTGLDLALSLAAGPAAVRRTWTSLIRSRAIVLGEIAARHRGVAGITRGAQELAEASQNLAMLTTAGPGRLEPDAYRRKLEEARARREATENALATQSTAFQQETARARIGLDEVERAMPRGSVLVAYARYAYSPVPRPAPKPAPSVAGARGRRAAAAGTPLPPSIESYVALVLREGDPDPRIVRLGAAAEIDSLVAEWGAQVSRPVETIGQHVREARYVAAGTALALRVWQPVAALVAGSERVFLVTDGSLDLVSFASLPAGAHRYLVESGPLIHGLSAERDMVPPLLQPRSGSGMLALGGPDFDHFVSNTAPVTADLTQGTATAVRGERASCGDFRSLHFESLPAASTEASEVAALWRVRPDAGAGELTFEHTGATASKATFMREGPGRSVLHLATHAFFLGGCRSALQRAVAPRGVPSDPDASPRGGVGDNPLLLSGLAFAGANRHAEAGAGDDDGIMTAEEVTSLDLSGVQWAVLSACETGVGQVHAGEGVFGLRRAFEIAGARTLIMSLWPIEDEGARHLMKALYEAHWSRGLATAEALRSAERSELDGRRSRGESTHPFYWAPFVAVGDWK